MRSLISPDYCSITPGPIIDGIIKEGLIMDDFLLIDDKYMKACNVASHLLQHEVFTKLNGKIHVKTLSGITEQLIFREKHANDMIKVTVHYDGIFGLMDEHENLVSKIDEVKRKLALNNLSFINECISWNGKQTLIYSFTLSMHIGVEVLYPIWLEVQFWNVTVTGFYLHDHAHYELQRLKRGDMSDIEICSRFPVNEEYECVEDEDSHDTNIVMRMLNEINY